MKKTTTADQIKNLKKMKSAALREQFHKLTGKEAPSNDRALLIKTITSVLSKHPAEPTKEAPEAASKGTEAPKKTDAKKASPTKAGAPRASDPRLPPAGTVLQKRDRAGVVRCECTIEEGGRIRYKGAVYSSLSGAAMAAGKDIGLGGAATNGWTFWGITKAGSRIDPLVALDRAWERYRGNVETLVKTGITDDNRSKVLTAIKKHVAAIEALRDKVA